MVGWVCRGGIGGWRVEAVGAEAGAGQEAQACPFAELGEHVAGFDTEEDGELVAAPVAWGVAGDDGGDLLPAGGRAGRTETRRGIPLAAGPAGLEVDGRRADGDVDRGDGGGMGRAAVVAVEVPGGGVFAAQP